MPALKRSARSLEKRNVDAANDIQGIRQSTVLAFLSTVAVAASEPANGTNIFAPASTPAKMVAHLSVFVLVITGIIFVVVFTLLALLRR